MKTLNLTRHVSTTLLPKTHRSTSITASNGAVFPPAKFPTPRLFLSLSSTPTSQPPPSTAPTSHPNAGHFFTWYRVPATDAGAGAPAAGRSETAAVVLGWLGATPRHLRRYAEMYTRRGIDAVTFVVPVRELMWFDLGRKVDERVEVLAKEVVEWLSCCGEGRERRLIFHTFSTTGWLVYGSILAHMQERPELIEKIKGCIVDSGGDPELNPKVWAAGFTAALLKKRNTRVSLSAEAIAPGNDSNTSVQDEDPLIVESAVLLAFEKLFSFLFTLPDVTQKLLKIISLLSDNQPPCPQLYLYSTADKVIRYRTVESFIEHQKMKGRHVRSFNFVSSPHVDHYRTFPDVYSSQVNSFVNEILAVEKQGSNSCTIL